jgi:hypothetical protein
MHGNLVFKCKKFRNFQAATCDGKMQWNPRWMVAFNF